MTSLTGKKAVITGGTRGIGFAIANKLKACGADILVTGTKPDFHQAGWQYHAVDFSSREAVLSFAAFLTSFAPDILINNAGINKINSFNDIALDDFLHIQQVNTTTPLQLCQAVLPSMKQKKWGRIINITSVWSKISKAGRASYSTSKFGLDGMMAALAAEVAEFNILVNGVAPGFVDTDLTRQTLGEQGIAAIVQTIPIKRLAKADEIAAFVAWLSSDENTYISGQNLVIDGGFTRV